MSANFGVDYKLDHVPLTLGGNFGFQSAGPVRISTSQSSYGVPKRMLDLYALWKFDSKTNLRLSLANALHQDNFSSSTYVDRDATVLRMNTSKTNLMWRMNFEHKF